MSRLTVLALVFQHQKSKGISVVPLTTEYTFKVRLNQPRASIEDKTRPTIVIEKGSTSSASLTAPIDSMTVVYGENGEGKTTLLLNICRSFTRANSDSPVGVIWKTASGAIGLQRGSQLPRVQLVGPKIVENQVAPNKAFGTIFYTTSPFEAARRKELAADGALDVTPNLGTHSFSGTSLCQSIGALPGDIDFISKTKIKLEIRPPSLADAVRRFEEALSPKKMPRTTQSRAFDDISGRLMRIAQGLTPRMQGELAIELHRARLQGDKAATALYYELTQRKSPVAGNEALARLIGERNKREGNRVPTSLMASSLVRLYGAVGRMPRGIGHLSAYAEMLKALDSEAILSIQEAESLGFVRWQFLRLSSGQVALLLLFASIGAALEKLALDGVPSALLVIDEGEMFMHPAWQRKYLSDLRNFVGHYAFAFNQIHLVVATHSLIVAGDAPPNRLFDVQSGSMRNGFAMGPKDVLTRVYGVREFAGEMTESWYKEVVGFLRSADRDHAREEAVRKLVDQIASNELKTYLVEEFSRRKERQNAKA